MIEFNVDFYWGDDLNAPWHSATMVHVPGIGDVVTLERRDEDRNLLPPDELLVLLVAHDIYGANCHDIRLFVRRRPLLDTLNRARAK